MAAKMRGKQEKQDIVEHILFKCPGWAEARSQAEEKTGVSITKDNMIDLMFSSTEEWEAIENIDRGDHDPKGGR